MQNTKSEILQFVVDNTLSFSLGKGSSITSNFVSEKLNVSRSLSSQYLNDLYKEGELIKIVTRPTYFLHKKTLEDYFQLDIQESTYYSIEEMMLEIHSNSAQNDFYNIVGKDGSLSGQIEQFLAAIKYPGNGLPVLIKGEAGVGKSLLCQEIFNYAQNNKIFNAKAQLIKIRLSENETVSWDEITESLDKCLDGILFLSNGQNISNEIQEKLIHLLEEREYVVNGNHHQLKAHLVMSYTSSSTVELNHELMHCFPVICELPNLNSRSTMEREDLVLRLLKRKARTMRKQICLTKTVLRVLSNSEYKDNIDGLDNVLTVACAKANSRNNGVTVISLTTIDLPVATLKTLPSDTFMESEETLIDVTLYQRPDIVKVFTSVMNTVLESVKFDEKKSNEIRFEKSIKLLQRMYDSGQLISNSITEPIVNKCFDLILKNEYTIPLACMEIINTYVYLKSCNSNKLNNWEFENELDISSIYLRICNDNPAAQLIAEKIVYEINRNISFSIGTVCKLLCNGRCQENVPDIGFSSRGHMERVPSM